MPDPQRPTPIDYQEWLAAPHEVFARLRAEHWWAPFEGAPVSEVLEYHAVRDLLADDAHLRSFNGGYTERVMRSNPNLTEEQIAENMRTNSLALINTEGEPHHRLRALVARNFTPRAVAAMGPFLAELAEELAATLVPGDDLMQGFARELPARALCRLLGIRDEDHRLFAGWIDVLEVFGEHETLAALDAEGAARLRQVGRDMRAYSRMLVQELRANPKDDLISRLANDPEGVSDDVIVQLLSDLVFAGNDTTRKMIGLMVIGLAHHADVWEAVAADPAIAPSVVEEALRLYSSAPGPVRQACSGFAYRDKAFAEGDVSALSIWSANRDEGFWGENASEFDYTRPDVNRHLSFGHGVHFCLGASLAREELRAALIALSRRITKVRVVEPPKMHPVGGIYGPISLRIGFEVR